MWIKVLTPTDIVLEAESLQVNARGRDGAFTLLPRHRDYVAALVPGVLCCRDNRNRLRLAAVDSGILVKCGDTITVCTRHAVLAEDWDQLAERVGRRFQSQTEQQKQATKALAELEADVMQGPAQWPRHET